MTPPEVQSRLRDGRRSRRSVFRMTAGLLVVALVIQLGVVTDLPLSDPDLLPPGASLDAPTQQAAPVARRSARVPAAATTAGRGPSGPPPSRGGVGSERVFPAPDTRPKGPGVQRADLQAPPPDKDSGPAQRGFVPGRSTEDTSKRTARSTEFSNPDGTRTLRMFSADTFVRAADGSMISIDPGLVPGTDGYRPRAAADVFVAARADSTEVGRLTAAPGISAGFAVDGATGSTASVTGSTARYPGVQAGVDLVLTATATGLKEEIVLSSADGPTEWLFPLRLQGLTPELAGPGQAVLFKDKTGAVRMVIPPGLMEDSSVDPRTRGPARSTGVSYQLLRTAGGWTLKTTVDRTWLRDPGRVFPVTVDPSIRLAPLTHDTHVSTARDYANRDNSWDGDTSIGTVNQSYVHPDLHGEYAAYFTFAMWGELNYKYIRGASLNLWNHSSTSCSSQPLSVYAVRQDWTHGPLAWPGPAYDAALPVAELSLPGKGCVVGSNSSVPAGWVSIPLPAARFTRWVHGVDHPIYGFTVRAPANRPDAKKSFLTSQAQQSVQTPFIDVVYSTHGAEYAAPTGVFDPPVTNTAKGKVIIRVTNWGEATWTPTNGYRLRATVTNSAGNQIQQSMFTIPGDTMRTWSTDVPVEIGPFPPAGGYTLRVTMVDPAGQPFDTAYGVPPGQVSFSVGNGPPTTRGQYPPHNGYVETLTPQLWVDYVDPDNYPPGGQRGYWFQICNGTPEAPVGCRESGWRSDANWPVPGGVLEWSRASFWYVKLSDSQNESPKVGPFYFTPIVPQPDVTAHLAGAPDGADVPGLNPQIGNYSTQVTDATVAVVGPPLQISRTYNSQDPRTTGAFGAGWSTLLDQRLDLDSDMRSNAVVTLESGRQLRFGRRTDGTYAPPPGVRLTLSATYAYPNGVGNPDPPAVSQPRATLESGQRLDRSGSLVSADGRFQLWLRDDGNLVLYQGNVGALWGTGTGTGFRLYNQIDGNLVLYRADGSAVWSSGTYGNGASTLRLQDDGNLVLYRDSDGRATWASGTWPNPTSASSALPTGQTMLPGATLYSPDFRLRLKFQYDGNLVLADRNGGVRWSSRTQNTARLINQGDGNLVLYRADGTPAWSSGTYGNGASTLRLQNDGNLVLYRDTDNWPTWATSTFVGPAAGMVQMWTTREAGGVQRKFDGDGRLTSIIDADGRVQILRYPAGSAHADRITDQLSGRSLSIEWEGAHVAAVSADPPASGQPAPRWTYSYLGDRLRQVCSPRSATSCTTYDTEEGSHYQASVLDGNPVAYWPLSEAGGGTAVNVAARSADEQPAQYAGVTVGQPGALAGSPDTAARFGGSATSALRLADNLLTSVMSFSVELWFKADAGRTGVLFAEQDAPLGEAAAVCIPALYVGTDGKLHGLFPGADGGSNGQLVSSDRVDNGAWHHAVLSVAVDTQTLYLDGVTVGQLTGRTIAHRGAKYAYVGNGRASSWPSAPTANTFPFGGLVDEVAVYRYPMPAGRVAAHYAARTATSRLTKVVGPGNVTDAMLTIDRVSGRVATVRDRNGAMWTVGAPVLGQNTRTVTLSSTSRSPITYTYDTQRGGRLIKRQDTFGVRTVEYNAVGFVYGVVDENNIGKYQGTDERGNVLWTTAWRDGDWRFTGTQYFVNPDDPLDPRNDKVTFVSGGLYDHSGLATKYTLDSSGRVTQVSYPWLAGTTTHPVERFTYSTGTEPAVGGGTVPPGLLRSHTSPRNKVTWFGYDRKGDMAWTTDPDGLITEFARDGLGRATTMTIASGAGAARVVHSTATYEYDAASQPVRSTASGIRNPITGVTHTAVTTTTYTAAGQPLRVEVADGTGGERTRVWTYAHDIAGRLASTTQPDGTATTQVWNTAGDMVRRVLASGLTQEYRYDDDHRLMETAAVGTGVDPMDPARTRLVLESRAYDPAGRLAVQVDAMGAERAYTYHNDNLLESERLVRRDAQGNVTGTLQLARYEYDEMGRQVRRTGPGGVVDELAYNFNGTLAREVRDPLGLARSHAYGRDEEGNATALTEATAILITPGTDGETPLLTDAGSLLNPSNWRFADKTASWTYRIPVPRDWTAATGRFLINSQFLVHASPDGQTWTEVLREPNGSGGESNLAEYPVNLTPYLRPGGNLYLRFSDNRPSDGWGAMLGRLIIDPVSTTVKPRQTTFTYDGGNRVLTRTVANPGGDPAQLTTTYTRDARGLLIREQDPTGSRVDYTYDAAGQFVTATQGPRTVWSNGTATADVSPQWTVGRNTFGEVTDERDPTGALTRTEVNAAGQPLALTMPTYQTPDGQTITATYRIEYDTAGRPVRSIDPLGNVAERAYDLYGRTTRLTEPDPDGAAGPATGGVWQYLYDRLGREVQVTDPIGAQTRATYDTLGHTLTRSDSDRINGTRVFYTTVYGYDDAGNQTSVKTPLDHVTTFEYNAAGQPTKVTMPGGRTVVSTYNAIGQPLSVVNAGARAQTFEYDAAGRQTAQSDRKVTGGVLSAPLRTSTQSYDTAGRVIGRVSGAGRVTRYTYDSAGLTSTIAQLADPAVPTSAVTVQLGYDAAGRRSRLVDGNGNATTFTYNAWGLPESTIEPGTTAHPDVADRRWTRGYNAAGHLVRVTSPGGVSVERTFDGLGRLTAETGSGAEDATTARSFGYDATGRLTRVSRSGASNTYAYNDRGLLTAASGATGAAELRYDAERHLISRQDSAGTATFGYRADGQLETVSDPLTGRTVTIAYHATGEQREWRYGTGAPTRTFTYDDLGRLATDTMKKPDGTTSSSVTYGYDLDDLVTGRTTTGLAGAGSNTYGYDGLGRLTRWTKPGGAQTTYDYDGASNRIRATDAAGVRTYGYDARNRLLAVTGAGQPNVANAYTPRGTLSTSTRDGATTTYRFDAFDQLTTVVAPGLTTTYSYDALGRLASRNGVDLSYSDLSNHPVRTPTSLGDTTLFRDPDGVPLSDKQGSAAARTLATDRNHGDLYAAYSADGALSASASYAPYGETTATNGGLALGFQGGFTDADTKLVNAHARWYSAGSAGFVSRDSYDLQPDPVAQTNRYLYANGNPTTFADPTGHCAAVVECVGPAGAVVAGGPVVWIAAGVGVLVIAGVAYYVYSNRYEYPDTASNAQAQAAARATASAIAAQQAAAYAAAWASRITFEQAVAAAAAATAARIAAAVAADLAAYNEALRQMLAQARAARAAAAAATAAATQAALAAADQRVAAYQAALVASLPTVGSTVYLPSPTATAGLTPDGQSLTNTAAAASVATIALAAAEDLPTPTQNGGSQSAAPLLVPATAAAAAAIEDITGTSDPQCGDDDEGHSFLQSIVEYAAQTVIDVTFGGMAGVDSKITARQWDKIEAGKMSIWMARGGVVHRATYALLEEWFPDQWGYRNGGRNNAGPDFTHRGTGYEVELKTEGEFNRAMRSNREPPYDMCGWAQYRWKK